MRLARTLAPNFVRDLYYSFILNYCDGYAVKSYAQEGEDILLKQLFESTTRGFYIDVGAHHPKKLSNTYYYYKKGWNGINIDAMPGSMILFNRIRPRDINIEVAVANENKEMVFYIFDDPALNTFDEILVHEAISNERTIVDKVKIKTKPLAEILTEHLPVAQKIDFMSIDVEGLDLDVLKSNNWQLFRPDYLLVESHLKYVDQFIDSELYRYITNLNYKMIAKTTLTAIFENEFIA